MRVTDSWPKYQFCNLSKTRLGIVCEEPWYLYFQSQYPTQIQSGTERVWSWFIQSHGCSTSSREEWCRISSWLKLYTRLWCPFRFVGFPISIYDGCFFTFFHCLKLLIDNFWLKRFGKEAFQLPLKEWVCWCEALFPVLLPVRLPRRASP